MPTPMLKKVKQAIERYRMLDVRDGVVVAVSGGPDSVALLDVLKHLSAEYNLRLIVAHLNHGLRPGPADEEESFVHQLSERLGLVCESKKMDIILLSKVQKKSIEETAREQRYLFLEEIRHKYSAQKIALGHQAQDQAETVLMNLLRGSGREGLKGMQPVREGLYIRPLLGITRGEISLYLTRRKLPYVVDFSNADDSYLRNRVRHQLIPELKARYNPRLEENLCRTAEILNREDDYLQRIVKELYTDQRIVQTDATHQEIRITISRCLGLHEALQSRLIKQLLLTCAQQMQGIGFEHINAVKALMQDVCPSGLLHLPFNMEVRREYNFLIIARRKKTTRKPGSAGREQRQAWPGHLEGGIIACDIQIPGRVQIESQKLTLCLDFVDWSAVRFDDSRAAYLDYGCILPPVTVRTPQPGDRIQPLGMPGMKKLKNYFIDRKIPGWCRGQVPLLVDNHSVIWIVGQLLSERVKLTDKTTKILKIEMTEMI